MLAMLAASCSLHAIAASHQCCHPLTLVWVQAIQFCSVLQQPFHLKQSFLLRAGALETGGLAMQDAHVHYC